MSDTESEDVTLDEWLYTDSDDDTDSWEDDFDQYFRHGYFYDTGYDTDSDADRDEYIRVLHGRPQNVTKAVSVAMCGMIGFEVGGPLGGVVGIVLAITFID